MQRAIDVISDPISDERAENKGNSDARKAGDVDEFLFRVFLFLHRRAPEPVLNLSSNTF
jgi:hypothetical protein